MPTSSTCGVPSARLARGAAAEDRLLLQEQIAFATDHLALLVTHHRQLCRRQQDLLATWCGRSATALPGSLAIDQLLAQQQLRLAAWQDIRAWSEHRRALLDRLRRIGDALPHPARA